ncbi:hypothetical protein TUBRATIS_20060 [Tubulinosema ratisbonensis]|uniref:Uncharacterized protein n=1 Tax=Tubulinosema ratisbonensis TaxID=291195 RepID=A0A437AKC9_9MICR|nr:hypothetical protein TUBRATIS_20060 [Tubulinosema ratisbonensis]
MRKRGESSLKKSQPTVFYFIKKYPKDNKIPLICWYDCTTQLIYLLYIISNNLKIITFFEALLLFFSIFILVMLLRTVYIGTNHKFSVQKFFINFKNTLSMITFLHFVIQSIYLINTIYQFTFHKIIKFYDDKFVFLIFMILNIYAIILLLCILNELKDFYGLCSNLKKSHVNVKIMIIIPKKLFFFVLSIAILILFMYCWSAISTKNFLMFYLTFLYYLNCNAVCMFIRLSGKKEIIKDTFDSDLISKVFSFLSVVFVLYFENISLYLQSELKYGF